MLALKLRIMLFPFYQPWVSKGGSFEEGGVNQYGIVNGFYLSQNMSLVYFDLCVHGSFNRGRVYAASRLLCKGKRLA